MRPEQESRGHAPPRGREVLLAHPPAPVDDGDQGEPRTTGGQHIRARGPPFSGRLGPPEDGGLDLEQGGDRAPAPCGRYIAHPRPDRRLPRRLLHGRRPHGDSPRHRRHRPALPDHSRTVRRCLHRLARPPDQRRAPWRPARRQPHQPPTVHSHRAHQRGLLRGTRQRPHGRRVHLAAARPSRPAPGRRSATTDPPDQRLRDAASASGQPIDNPTLPEARSRPVGREAQHRSRDTARHAVAAQPDHASNTTRCTDGWPTGSRQQPPRQRHATDASVLPGNDPRCSAAYNPAGQPRGPAPRQEHPENRDPPDLGPPNPREPRAVSHTQISTSP